MVYCSVEACGEKLSTTPKTIEKIAHTPAEAVEENRVEASCETAGSYESVVYCSVEKCKAEISRVTTTVPAKGHSFTKYESNNDATCTEDGTKTATCDRCSETDTQADEGSKLSHSYNAVVTAPTCVEEGYTTYTCACGHTYIADETAVLGHNWQEATYDAPETCSRCQAIRGEKKPPVVDVIAPSTVTPSIPEGSEIDADKAEEAVKDYISYVYNVTQPETGIESQENKDVLTEITKSLSGTSYETSLLITLIKVEVGEESENILAKKVTYDVSPMIYVLDADRVKLEETKVTKFDKEITFRLPVDTKTNATKANVWHGDELLDPHDIITDENDNKYVEVKSKTFSEFSVEPICNHSWKDGACTICGTVCSHANYVDGECEVCGKAVITGAVDNYSVSPFLSLESNVYPGFTFRVTGFAGIAREELAKRMKLLVFYTKTPTSADSNIETADAIISGARCNDDGTYTLYGEAAAAKNMGDSKWYKMCVELSDGSYVYSGRFEYSPRIYAKAIVEDTNRSDEIRALCVAMMNYGAAAQKYFADRGTYSYDSLMNVGFENYQYLVEAFDSNLLTPRTTNTKQFVLRDNNQVLDSNRTKFSDTDMTLTLEGMIKINISFTTKESFAEAGVVFWDTADYKNLTELTLENASDIIYATDDNINGNTYTVQYKGKPAKEMGDTIMVSGFVKIGDTYYFAPIQTRSVEYYAEKIISNPDKTEYIKNLVKEMVVYGDYAIQYFASRN